MRNTDKSAYYVTFVQTDGPQISGHFLVWAFSYEDARNLVNKTVPELWGNIYSEFEALPPEDRARLGILTDTSGVLAWPGQKSK